MLIGLGALAVAAPMLSCSSGRPSTTVHDLAEAYVRVTLQLAQHRPSLVDAWTGPEAWRPGPRVPVAELRASVDALAASAERIRAQDIDPTERPRLSYLRGQLRALALVARRLLGESITLDDEVRLAFGRGIPPIDDGDLAAVRAALDADLKGPGALADRYRAFRRQFVVPEAHIDRVLAAAIETCRAGAAPHIALPPDERVEVAFDPSVEGDAHARYLGRHQTRVSLSSRSGHDVAALLHMACHETYAGHHLQHVLIDDALVRGRAWLEFALTPAFGPHLLIAEGAAEVAVDLALPETARAAIYRDRLLPIAGLRGMDTDRLARVAALGARLEGAVPQIVAGYLDGDTPADRTADALRASALLPSPERFLSFAERRRTSAVVYPIGRAAVSEWIARGATDVERWRRLRDIFTLRPFDIDQEAR